MGYQFNFTIKGNSEVELINNLMRILRSHELYVATKAEVEALDKAQANLKKAYESLFYENANGKLVPKKEGRSGYAETLCNESFVIGDIVDSVRKRDGKQ